MGQNYVKFGTFYDQLYELQLQEVTKVFDYFSVQLFKMKSNKKQYPGYFLKSKQLLKELRQRFFELELEHCTVAENPL